MKVTLQQIQEMYVGEILEEIKSVLIEPVITEPNLRAIIEYQLGLTQDAAGLSGQYHGKMLRPLICLLACRAAGGNHQQAVPAAAALELIHNFSLVHDDIQDRSPERRHRPTVWKMCGVYHAITAGDAMYAVACLALIGLSKRGVSLDVVMRVMTCIFETCMSIAEGQYLDLCLEDREDVGVEEYIAMAKKKTGSLIGCSARVGALIAAQDNATADGYARFGENIGLAFQIVDDVLGIWGAAAATGKPVGEDIARGKKSLPVVYALEGGHGGVREIYRRAPLTQDDVSTVTAILDRVGARERALSLARHYCAQGLMALEETCPANESRDQLRDLALFLSERDF